jgi:hypothetical protein
MIDGVDKTLPPGTYLVETDEEQIPGLTFLAYRRLQTVIVVPATVGSASAWQSVVIEPDALELAVCREKLHLLGKADQTRSQTQGIGIG